MSETNLEIADIFNQYAHLLGGLSKQQYKVIRAIQNCRTSVLGGHKIICNTCEYEKYFHNSCRNRHCPKCGFTAKTKWVGKRSEDLLDCQYFHIVFTLPARLRALILKNKKVSYDILFKASSETLKLIAANKKYLGAEIGFIGVLHTWGQNLIDHPHIHYLVPGGGLRDGDWIQSKSDYFLPVKVLSKVYQGKILEYFEKAFELEKLSFKGEIDYLQSYSNFKNLLIDCADKDFIVYAKKPFAGPEQVIKYLGQYTHRIAISNYRLVKLEDDRVYFKVRDKDSIGKSKVISIHVIEFMKRFLLHVLPKAYVRIRHFGLLGNRFKKIKLRLIRNLQGVTEKLVSVNHTWNILLKNAIGIDIEKCPNCNSGKLIKVNPFLLKLSSA